MKPVSHFRLGEPFSWCSHDERQPHLPVFLPLHSSLLSFLSSIYPTFVSHLHPHNNTSKSTIGTTLQWSRARLSLLPSRGVQGLRYDNHHGSRYCTWYNSHCTRMTGVRRLELVFVFTKSGERRRSEIILSKLDLDNTSERTCVTFDCFSPLFCILSSGLLLAACWKDGMPCLWDTNHTTHS